MTPSLSFSRNVFSMPATLVPAIPDVTAHTTSPGETPVHKRRFAILCLASLGIVYGDIGTSPLYAMRECFYGEHAVPPNQANVLGSSLSSSGLCS
jgi:hypothetical protein